MKANLFLAIIFFIQPFAFAKAVEDTGLSRLKNSVSDYLREKTASDEAIKTELKQMHARLVLHDESGQTLDAEQAKIHLARQDSVIMVVTWPDKTQRVIRLAPNLSSEIVNAVHDAYIKMGGQVSR